MAGDEKIAPKNAEQSGDLIGPVGKRFLIAWVAFVLLSHIVPTLYFAHWLRGGKLRALELGAAAGRADRLTGTATLPETTPPPGHEADVPLPVSIGVYIDRIVEVSPKDSSWSVDFYCWFRWKSAAIQPGDTAQVVNGQIETRQLLESNRFGEEFYSLYRMTARITKVFDISRFPCDDHLLVLSLEDSARQAHQLKYMDDGSSSISTRAKLSGYIVGSPSAIVQPHAYRTRRGNIELPKDFRATYSQFSFALPIHRAGLGFFFKMFQGLFAAAGVAMLAFLIVPTHVDPRFGLGVGSFFAAIANQYVVSSLLPETSEFALCDIVSGLGLATIFLAILQSCFSLYLFDSLGHKALSKAFDRCSLWSMGLVYLACNLVLLLSSARLS